MIRIKCNHFLPQIFQDNSQNYTITSEVIFAIARGYLGTVYQTYLDAVEIVDNCDMNELEKEKEKLEDLGSQKTCFWS